MRERVVEWLRAFPRRFGEVCALTPFLNLNISKRLHWHNPGVSSFFLEVDLPCMKLRGGCFCREFVSHSVQVGSSLLLSSSGNRGNEKEERQKEILISPS